MNPVYWISKEEREILNSLLKYQIVRLLDDGRSICLQDVLEILYSTNPLILTNPFFPCTSSVLQPERVRSSGQWHKRYCHLTLSCSYSQKLYVLFLLSPFHQGIFHEIFEGEMLIINWSTISLEIFCESMLNAEVIF